MGLIDKDIARNYEELAKEFCIPQGTIGNIAYNNRNNSAWHGLNVYTWLQGNTEVYDEGVKANVRWLYDAVRTIDKKLGTKIAKAFKISEPKDEPSQKEDKGGLVESIGIEETDSKEPLGSIGAGQGRSKSDEQSSDEGGKELRQRTSRATAHSSGTKGSDDSLSPKASVKEPSASNPPHSDKWHKLENCVVGLVLLGVMLILIFVGYVAFHWYSIEGFMEYYLLVVMFVLICVGYLAFNWHSVIGLILYGAFLLVIVFVVAEIFSIWESILRIVILGAFIMVSIGIPILLTATLIKGDDVKKLKPLIALLQSVISSAIITPQVIPLVLKGL